MALDNNREFYTTQLAMPKVELEAEEVSQYDVDENDVIDLEVDADGGEDFFADLGGEIDLNINVGINIGA